MLGVGVASAQPGARPGEGTVARGRVIDEAGKPVAGATISVEGNEREVVTNAEGQFAIAAAEGASLIVLREGFAAQLATASAAVGDVVLLAEDRAAETIEIRGEAPIAHGAARLDRETIQRIPGTGNDVVRSLSAMPGVASHPLPLGQAGVVIRGSSPHDSKVLVDDFEVPSIYHDVGFRSIVPAEAIDSLEYIPGGFDVAYGRATSGVVSLTTRAGGEHRAQQAELSAGELGVLAQGAFARGRYLIAFRRSAIDLLLPLLLPDDLDLALTTVPRYYDEQIRIDYQLTTRWQLRVSSVGSDDALELYASRDRNPDKRFANRLRFARVTAAARYHDGPWSATLALSGIAQQQRFERGVHQHLEATAPALTARAEVMRTAERAAGLTELAWRLGAEVVTTRHGLDLAMPADRREGEPMRPDDPMDTSNRFSGAITTQNVATWTSLAARLDPRVRVTAGVRVDGYMRNRDVAIQPRGELAITLAPGLVARLSAGAYSRPPEHQSELLAPGLAGERSTQLIAGLGYEPAEGVRLQGSTYFTERRRMIARDPSSGMLGNTGRGATLGAELLGSLHRGPWFGWLSYSYSHSTRVDRPGDEARLFDHDQPHNLQIATSYRHGRWQFGARFRMHSGMPQTPVQAALFDSDANIYYPVWGLANSERAPLHHQLDLRIDRTFRRGPIKMTKFLDIQNVYLNDSVVGYFYGFDYSQRAAFRSLPILPTAGLRGEF
jgi:outer membrane receptor protein involved in Fe transport